MKLNLTKLSLTILFLGIANYMIGQNPCPPAAFTFSSSATTVCGSVPVNFSIDSPDPAYTYSWDFGDPASNAANTATGVNVNHAFTSNPLGATYTVTAYATPVGPHPVTWTNIDPDLTLLANNDFTKTSGSNWWNAGAESNELAHDDHYMEFSAPTSNSRMAVGLGRGNIGNDHFNTIDFGFRFENNGTFRIYESGSNRGTFGNYSYNDVMRVAVEGGVVNYYQNGNLLYTSNVNPNLPLFVDFSIRDNTDTLRNVVMGASCSSTATSTITTNATPYIAVDTANSDLDACIAVDNLGFTNSVITISTAGTYTLDWGDGSAPSTVVSNGSNQFVHTYSAHGIYTITISAPPIGGCGGVWTHDFLYLERPSADMVVANTDICEGDTVWVINNTDTTNITHFYWDWGDGTIEPVDIGVDSSFHIYYFTDQFACMITQDGFPYDITLHAFNACFEHTNSSPINVIAEPRISYNAPTVVCESFNDSVGVDFTSFICPPPPDALNDLNYYVWTFGDSANIGDTAGFGYSNPTHMFSGPGEFLVNVQVLSQCNLFQDSFMVRVLEEPNADASFTFTIANPPTHTNNGDACTPTTIEITNSSTGDSLDYNWTILTNVVGGVVYAGGTGPTDPNPQFEFILPGEYIIVLNAFNDCASSTWRDTLVIIGPPDVNLDPPTPTCDTFYYTPSVTYSHTLGMIDTYTWSFPGGIPASSTDANPGPIMYVGVGPYTVDIQVSNECGFASDQVTFDIELTPDPVTINNGNANLCIDDSPFNLTATPSGGTWSGQGITSFTNGTFDPAIAGVGTHTITYTYQPGNCPAVIETQVTVHDLPNLNAGSTQSICINAGLLTLTGATPAGGTWSGTGVDGVAGTFDPVVAGVGFTTVTYTFTDANTCTNSVTKQVEVYDLPALNLAGNTVQCDGSTDIQLSFSPTGGTWSGTGIVDPNAGTFNPQTAGGLGTYRLYYTFTDGNGCTNMDSIDVQVVAGATVFGGPDSTVCITDNPVDLATGSPSGGIWSGSGVIATGSSTYAFYPSVAGSGTHTLTYTYGNGSCQASDPIDITVNDTTTLIVGPDVEVCFNSAPFSLGGTPAGGVWTGPGILAPGNPTFYPVIAPGTYTLTYTYTDAGTECTSTATRNVTIRPFPSVVTSGFITECNSPDTLSLLAYGTPLGGTWSGQGVIDGTAGTFSTVLAGGEGLHFVTYTFTDSIGCSGVGSMAIDVIAGPAVSAGPGDTLCFNGGSVPLLGGTPSGGTWSGLGVAGSSFFPGAVGVGTHPVYYTQGSGSCEKMDTAYMVVTAPPIIDPGPDTIVCETSSAFALNASPAGGAWSGTGVSGDFFDPAVSGVGIFTLTYTYSDPVTTCSDSETRIVEITGLPVVNVNGPVLYCNIDEDITLTNYTPAGGTWSGSGITDPVAGTFNPVVAGGLGVGGADTSYNLIYVFVDGGGCSGSDTLKVDVTQGVIVAVGPPEVVCQFEPPFELSGFTPAGGLWSGPGIVDANDGTFDPSAVAPGIYEVIYTAGTGSCEFSDTTTVTVGAIPIVEAGPDLTVCESDTAFALTGHSPVGDGQWTGTGITDSITGIFDPAIAGAGTFTLTYYYEDVASGAGCSASDTRTIIVNPRPTVTLPDTLEYCNSSDNITISGYSPVGGTWSGLGIVNAGAGIFNSDTAGGIGFYTITYNYTGANGCVTTDSLVINVTNITTISAGIGGIYCVTEDADTLTGNTPIGGTWSGTGITDQTVGIFDPAIAGVGFHDIIYAHGSGSCEVFDTITIEVGGIPTVSSGPSKIYCETSVIDTLTGYTPVGGVWSGIGVINDTLGVFDPSIAGAGTHSITYTYSVGNTGCEGSVTNFIVVEPVPVVDAGDTISMCDDNASVQLTNFSPNNGNWTGIGIIDGANGLFNPFIAGIGTHHLVYSVVGTNGCVGSDSLVVEVLGDTIYAGPDLDVCVDNGLVTLTGGTPAGGVWTGTGIIDPSGIFDPTIPGGGGTVILTYSTTSGVCQSTDQISVFVSPPLNVIAGENDTLCNAEPAYQLTGFAPSPGGYWTGIGIIDSAGVFDPSLAGIGSHQITYHYSVASTGCSGTDSKFVVVTPPPVVSAGGATVYCNTSDNIQLTNFTPSGGFWSMVGGGPGIVDAFNGIFNAQSAGGLGSYQVVYTVSSGTCTDRDTLTIDVVFGDTVEAGPNDTVCINEGSFPLLGASPAGGTWSGDGIIDPINGTFDPATVGAGLHTVTYTYGSGTCEKSDDLVVWVSELPGVNAGPDQSVCLNDTAFNMSAFSPAGGRWSGTGITDSILGTFDPSINGTGTFIITYHYIDTLTGCENFDTKEIEVLPLPVIMVTDTLQYCATTLPINLTGYSPSGGFWTGNGIVDAFNGIFNSNGIVGTYPLVYHYASNGCTVNDTLVIDVIFGDTVEAGPNDTVCINEPFIVLTGSPAGGTWSGDGIINTVSGVFDPATAGVGFHTITYTSGSGTCLKLDDLQIFVSGLPNINAGIDQTICVSDTAFNFTGFSPAGGVWSGIGITDSILGTFDPAVSGTGSFTATYSYTDTITGCDNVDAKIIDVVPLPVVTLPDSVEYCDANIDINLTGHSPIGGTWTGNGIVDPFNGIFNSNGIVGIYPVVYTYSTGGCSDADTMIIVVTPAASISAGPDDTTCINAAPFALTGQSPAGGIWSGTGIIDPINGVFDPSVSGTGIFTLTYTQGTGTCQRSDDIQMFVSELPSVNAGPDQDICVNETAYTFTGFSPVGGLWTGQGLTDSLLGIIDASTLGVGTYTYTYTYTDSITGCSNSDTREVTILPIPVVTTLDSAEYCNSLNNITLTGYSPSGGIWSGPGIVDAFGGVFNSISAGGVGTYNLVYSVSSGGCTGTDTMVVTVIFGDTVEAGPNDTVCIDDAPFNIMGASPAGGTWSGDGITDVVNGTFDPATAGLGSAIITYTYGTGSCEKTDQLTIFVGSTPIVDAGPNETVCLNNGAFNITGFSPQNGTWSGFGITDTILGTFDPTITGLGTFTVTYTFADPTTDCENSDDKVIDVVPLPMVVVSDTVEYCFTNNDITLTGYGPNGGIWSGTGIVDAANGIFNANIAGGIGTYHLVYTYANGNNCSDQDTMVVNVIYGDTVEAGPAQFLCIDDGLYNLTGFSPFGGTWSGIGILDPQAGTFDPQVAGTGLHTLVYTYGTGSCEKSDSTTIFVGDPPAVFAGPDISVCFNATPFNLVNASPAGGFWTGLGVDSSGFFTPSTVGVGTYPLVYTYTNTLTDCSNTDTLEVSILPPPVVEAGGPVVYCNTNQNITLTGYSPAGGLWSGNGIVDGINGIFNANSAGGIGTYQVVYTYVDGIGCSGIDTLDIEVIFGDTVEAGPNDTICIDNGVFILSGYSPPGGTWSGTGIIDANLGIFDPMVSGTGTHTLSYTYGVGTCQKTDTKTIFVDALPIMTAGPNDDICVSALPFNFTGFSPQGGVWTGIGIVDPATGLFDPSIAGTGSFTMTYTYTNPITNCDSSDTKIVNVTPVPQVTAGGDVIYCDNPDQITLTGYSPTGGTWSGPGIVNANTGTFSTILAGGVGTYDLVYTISATNGCDARDTLRVEVIYGDTVLAGSNESICEDAGLLTLTGYTPLGGTWSGTGITDPSGVFNPSLAGVGTHILTYSYGTGTCEKTPTKSITVTAPPLISAGVDETVCEDVPAFQIQGYSPTGGVWSGTGITDTALGIFDPQVAGIGTFTLTYYFINLATGCEGIDTKDITVAPLPVVNAGDTIEFCNISDNITLTATPAGGVWTGPGVVDGNLGIFNTTQAGGIGTYVVTYTMTDSNSCVAADDLVINVIFGDTVTAGTAEAICIDAGLITLTGSPVGGTWSGNGIIDPVAGIFDPQNAGLGNHVLTYTYGAGTCEKESNKTIFVGGLPIVEAGPNEEMCIDQPAYQLQQFSPVGGTWSGVGITDSIVGIFDPAVAGQGTHTIRYTFFNSITGCEDFDTKTVVVNPLPVVAGPDSLEYCNTSINITLSGYTPLGGVWTGTGIVDPNNGIFNTTVAGGVGNYNITYTYTDVNGCESSTMTNINVIFGDTVEAGPNFALCEDDLQVILTGFSPPGGTWSGPGIIDPTGVFDPQAAVIGQFNTITYTFGTGTCAKTDTRVVFVGEIPTVIAGPDEVVCQEELAFNLTGFSPPNGFWTGVGITDSAGVFDPQIAGVGTWTLTYTYVDATTGCENFDTKQIEVQAPPAVDAGPPVTYCNSTNNIVLDSYSPTTGGIWNGPGIVDALNGIWNPQSAGGLGANNADTIYQVVYSFTNGVGCSNTDTLDITLIFGDTVYAGEPDTVCIDDPQFNLIGYTPTSGGTWSGQGIIDPVVGTFDPATAGVGLHTISYTFGTGTCEKTDDKTIYVGPLPLVSAGIDEVVCIDEPAFNITNFTPQGGVWTGVGITDPSGIFDPAIAGVGIWTLTYTFTNNITNCDNFDTKTIEVAPLPVVTAGGTVVYCNTTSDITLTNYSPSGGTWSGPGIVSSNLGIFSSILAGGIGSYELEYSFTDGNGCTSSDTLLVEIIFGDTVLAGQNLNVCIDDGPITLTGYTPPSGGTWSGTGITDPVNGIFDPGVAGLGTHTLTWTYGTGTCEKTATRTVFVGQIPIVEAGPNLTICEDASIFQLSGNSPVGGTWAGTGVTDSIVGLFDPQIAGVGTYTIVYTFVNALTGCENQDTRTIEVAPLPTVSAGGTVVYCNTTSDITLTNYSPSGGTWNGSGIVNPNIGLFSSVLAGGIGTYELEYSFTDVNGCTNSDTLLVEIIFGDTVLAGQNLNVCIDDGPITLTGYTPPSGGTWSGIGITDPVNGVFDPGVAGLGTHTLTWTHGTGTCEKTATRTVFVGQIPIVEAGPDLIICEDASIFQLSGNSPVGGTWAGTGVTDSIVGLFDPQIAGVGTYTIVYTFVNALTGCENQDTRTIEVAPLPTVSAGGTVVYCNTTSDITLSNYSPSGGTWNGPGIVNPNIGLFSSVLAGGIGTYELEYSFTDVNGCTNSDTLLVEIIFGDTVLAGQNLNVCIDDGPITLTGYTPPSGGVWSGIGITDPVNGIFDPGVAGLGTHTLTWTHGTGTCEKTATRTVFVGQIPVVDAGPDLIICEDASIFQLSGNSPVGGTWAGTGVTDSIVGLFDPQLVGVGTYTIVYTFVNALTGCEDQDTRTIEVAPLPTVTAGGTVVYCNTTSDITLSNYSPTGGTWNGPGIVNPNLGLFSSTLAGGIGTYELEYSFTDINGCTNSDTLLVEIIFGDTVYAGQNMNVCIDDGQITLAGHTPPSGGTWSGDGIVDAVNGIFDPVIAGVGTHTLTWTHGTGTCEKTATRTVFVGQIPVVDAGPDLTICEDAAPFQLTGNSPIGGIWAGAGITDSIVGMFDPAVTGIGTYTIVYTFTNALTGCEDQDTRIIDVVPLPIVVADDTIEFCINNNNVTLSAYVNWSPAGGTWTGPGVIDPVNGLFNATIAGGLANGGADTSYNLVYTYVDGNGCGNSDVMTVNLIFGDTVEAGPNDTLCLDDNPLVLTGYYPAGGTWSGNGVDPQGTFDPLAAGVGTHTLTYTFGTGTCLKEDTKEVLVGAPPTISIGPDQTVCIDGAAFNLIGYSPQGGVWAGVGIIDSLGGTFDPQVAGIGSHILTYTFTNSVTGCASSAQRTVTVAPLPVVFAGDTVTYCDNPNDITLSGYSPPGGTWSGPGIIDPTQGIFNTVIAGGVGTYNLVYSFTDGNGCNSRDTLVADIIFGDSIDAGPNLAVCISDGLITFTGFQPANGVWSGPGIIDPAGVFDPQVAGPGPATVYVSTVDTGTCYKTDSRIIFVGTPPVVNPGADETVCESETAYALAGFSPPGGVWSGVGITDSINGIFDPQIAGLGQHVILYTVTNSVTNCVASGTKIIDIVPLPFVDAGDTSTYCDNPDNIVLNTPIPSTGGIWSGPGILNPSNGIFNTQNAGGLGVNGADTSHVLFYTYTDQNGCTDYDSLVVDIIFGDTVLAGDDDTVCINELAFILQGSPAGGSWSGTGVTNGGLFDPAIAGGGLHTVTYTFGTGSCEKTDDKTIYVALPIPVDAGGPYTVCIDAPPVTLTGFTPAGGVWTGSGIIDPSGVFDASVVGVGSHTITYTITDELTGCVSFDQATVDVVPLPAVSAGGTATFCVVDYDVALPTPSPLGGTWFGPGVTNSSLGLFNPTTAGGIGMYQVTYSYTDGNGCTNTDIATIDVIFGDTINAGPDRIACIDGDTITLTGFSPVGGTWSGMGVIDPVGLFLPSAAGSGVHELIYTQGTGTCEKMDTITISVVDVTTATAGPDEEFCFEDGVVVLTGNTPTGGIWAGPGILDPNTGTFVTQAVGIDTQLVTVSVEYTYTDGPSGCSFTDDKLVTVNPLPKMDFILPDTACSNVPVTFTNDSEDAISYIWYFGDGDTSIFLNPMHTYDTAGTYTVTLVGFTDKGCPDTISHDIVIFDIPQADFVMDTDTGCGPLIVTFSDNSIGQEMEYAWDFGNGQTSTLANPGPIGFAAGTFDTTYTVTLTVTNRCGTTTTTNTVTVFPTPNVVFGPNVAQGCTPLTVSFSNATTGNATSYLWNFGDGTTSTDSIPPAHVFNTINDTITHYTVTLTASNHCGTDVESVVITVEPGSLNAGFNASVTEGCQPLTVDFTSLTQPGDNVSWYFGYDNELSALLNPTHTFDTAGTFTVYQYVNNNCGFDTATIDITVHPAPPISYNHQAFVCVGQEIQFFNTSDSIAGNLWQFGDGDTSTLISPLHVYNQVGFYEVVLTNYSTTNLCPITDTTIVEVKPNPTVNFAPDMFNGCAPLTINFNNTSSGAFSSWDFGDGNVTILNSPTHTYNDAGQYSVTLTTTDNFGCFSDTAISGIVAYPKPTADFETSTSVQCGVDADVTFMNTSQDADAYFWNFGNGQVSNMTSPTISYNNVGDHQVTLVATNTYGCADTTQDLFTTHPGPIADFGLEPQAGCAPHTVQFIQFSANANSYYWYFGDGDTSRDANPIHTYMQEGFYDVTFIASLDDECFDTLTINDVVDVQGSPTAAFQAIEPDPNNPTGVLQMVNLSTDAVSYFWDFGDGATSDLPNPRHEFLENGPVTISLIAFSANGCSDTAYQVITPPFFKGLFVPNAFSPDAGIGDVRVWRPVGVGIADYRAQIFTPWGELLWESTALDAAGRPSESWDGTNPNGDAMPQGAYVWKIFAVFEDGSQWKGQENTLGQTRKIGSVTLLR